MNIVLTPDGPLDARATLARYHLWGEDPTNQVTNDVVRRVLRLGRRFVPYEVRWSGPVDDTRIAIRIPGVGASAVGAAAAAEVRRLFGLDLDLVGFYRMAKADPALASLVEPLYGLRPTLAPTPFEMLVGSTPRGSRGRACASCGHSSTRRARPNTSVALPTPSSPAPWISKRSARRPRRR